MNDNGPWGPFLSEGGPRHARRGGRVPWASLVKRKEPKEKPRPSEIREIEAEAEASDAPHVAGPVPARSAGMSLSSEPD